MLQLQQFLLDHPNNYAELLSEKPYCIDIKEKGKLRLFKYNQIASDFSNPLVRECRGIILEVDTWRVVCYPYNKFGNYGESYCPELDWSTTRVLTKIDGSLIKLYYYDGWNIATNGTIDAYDAEIESFGDAMPYHSFGELALVAFDKYIKRENWYQVFTIDNTYMFELTSPYNKVVVPHNEIDITFIGVRNNITYQEEYIGNHKLAELFPIPNQYPLHSLEDCINAAFILPFSEEGYVAVDGNFNRVKIKSPAYVAVHHLKGEGGVSVSRAIDLIKLGELDEFLNYFPEFKEIILEIKDSYNKVINKLACDFTDYLSLRDSFINRKEMAIWNMKNCVYPSLQFSLADNKYVSFKDAFNDISNKTIIELMTKVSKEK